MDEQNRVSPAETTSERMPGTQETETETDGAPDRAGLSLRDINLFLRDLVIIIAVIVSIRFLVATPFEIRGSSMETTYHDGEYIIADKLSYLRIFDFATLGDPHRGDVVVFHPGVHDAREFYIKRVIGLPGDRVRFENGEVYLTPAGSETEVMLDESYLSEENDHKTFLPPGVENDTFVVPAGEYFLMGDNRNNSSDSRSCFLSCFSEGSSHYVPRAHIVGKVFLHLGHFDAFGDDSYFSLGTFSWTHPPRFFSTASTWDYPEIDALTSGSGAVIQTGSSVSSGALTATGA
jgi:signal peptidase I